MKRKEAHWAGLVLREADSGQEKNILPEVDSIQNIHPEIHPEHPSRNSDRTSIQKPTPGKKITLLDAWYCQNNNFLLDPTLELQARKTHTGRMGELRAIFMPRSRYFRPPRHRTKDGVAAWISAGDSLFEYSCDKQGKNKS